MDGNRFTGSIPTSVSRLEHLGTSKELSTPKLRFLQSHGTLESFFLFNNRLSGPLPSELGYLTQLEHLRLDANALTGSIPKELGDLSKLGKTVTRVFRTAPTRPPSSLAFH